MKGERSESEAMPDLLLVEDNALHIRLVKSMLADVWPEPNTLRTARRLSTAIARTREQRPDCVLLDLLLPDATGLEAVNALLAEDHTVPIVVLSSHEDDDLALQAVREGAQDYLVKGTVGPEALARAIRFSMQRQRMDRPAAEPLPRAGDFTPASFAVIDADGVVRHVEAPIAEMLALTAEDLIGKTLTELSQPSDAGRWEAALERIEPGSVATELTVRLKHASDNSVQVRLELTPLLGANGTVFLTHLYPQAEEGTQSSGGHYAVVKEWVGG
ncbi:MAG: response regulator [Acidimicrobiia bacterium]